MAKKHSILAKQLNKWIVLAIFIILLLPLVLYFILEKTIKGNESCVNIVINNALKLKLGIVNETVQIKDDKELDRFEIDKSFKEDFDENGSVSSVKLNRNQKIISESRGVNVENSEMLESDDEFDEFNTTMGFKGEYYYFMDPRDGQKYKVIKVGGDFWFAENLKYKPLNGKSWSYNNNSLYVSIYGMLYDWETANVACPKGWRLPTDNEWGALELYFGGRNSAGEELKSKVGWQKPNVKAENTSGFSALPGGYRSETSNFSDIRKIGAWWTSSEVNKDNAWYRNLSNENTKVYRYYINKNTGYSVRCVK